MARKTKKPAPKPERRSREEIDLNFFFGDVFIKTGVAVALVIAAIAALTPFSLRDALNQGMDEYLIVMGGFGLLGLCFFLTGRHLRRQATHWDFD